MRFSCSIVLALPVLAWGKCPGQHKGTPPDGHAPVPSVPQYSEALDSLDFAAVVKDIEALLPDSQTCWPADYGNYGPFFIRLAWHCSGSYRNTDGRGGCGGGRQRFDPEASWEDNKNLNHARALLAPIKDKFGDALSWGDLFVTAGTVAIKSMGGPISKFCVGRVDDPDGTSSLDLGPSEYQEKVAPCKINGKCEKPLGSTTVGLIYLNPEGPVAQNPDGSWSPVPDPALSAYDIRDAFGRMGMNDSETVALIGGGHAFGRTHIYTSGFDGPWTTTPTAWSNEFFNVLQDYEWEKIKGPGGHFQWKIKGDGGKYAGVMRLTSDVALMYDESYKKLVKQFAADIKSLDVNFANAWLKLTTSGGIWATNTICHDADYHSSAHRGPYLL